MLAPINRTPAPSLLAAKRLLILKRAIYVEPESRRIGYVPQGYGLFPHLDVLDNIGFGRLPVASRGECRMLALAALDEFDCRHLAGLYPRSLSGGERQQVALMRALLTQPALLLLDEPLSALDVASRRKTREFLVRYLREQSSPSIVVTHDARDVLALDGEVVVLEAGQVVQRGSAAALAKAPINPFVEAFSCRDLTKLLSELETLHLVVTTALTVERVGNSFVAHHLDAKQRLTVFEEKGNIMGADLQYEACTGALTLTGPTKSRVDKSGVVCAKLTLRCIKGYEFCTHIRGNNELFTGRKDVELFWL